METKKIHPWFRNVFITGCLLSLMAAIQLFLLSDSTDMYFAWTIDSTLTAATLGGFYVGSMTFGFLSARETTWANVRGSAIGLFFFVTGSMVVTLLHLDKFHFGSGDPLPRLAAWIWLAIYVLLPVGLVAAFIAQFNVRGSDPQRTTSLPNWYRAVLSTHSMIGLVVSFALFFAPHSIIPSWPWTLTPLTARALSAWLFSFGVLDLLSLRENDWARLRVMSIAYTASAGFAMIALLRYAGQANLTSIGGIGYLSFMMVMLACGAYGWRNSKRFKTAAAQ